MFKKYTILTLTLLLAGQQASSMSLFKKDTSMPEYGSLLDTIERCPVGDKKCLDFFSKYKDDINSGYTYNRGSFYKNPRENNNTLFEIAVRTRSLAEIDYLVQLGADVNKSPEILINAKTRDYNFGVHPNFFLIGPRPKLGDGDKCVEYLISKGADIKKFPYILGLANNGSLNILRQQGSSRNTMACFLRHGADVNAKNKFGETALHNTNASLKKTQLLVRNGANVNARDRSGCTPLHYACNAAVAKYLVKHGADIDAVNNDGYTPISKQIKDGDYAIAAAMTSWSFMKKVQEQKKEFYTPTFID